MERRPRAHLGDRGVAFVASIATAFTGYLSQQNFDSQWIVEAKDGLNAAGVHFIDFIRRFEGRDG